MSESPQLLRLLEEKNYWYRKYLSSNEAFSQALTHAPEVALEELELFYGNRESLLKIIERIDARVQSAIQAEPLITSTQRTLIQAHIREKDSIIKRIVELDSHIIAKIDALKALGEEKLRLLAKGKKALAKYKSNTNYNEKLDKRV